MFGITHLSADDRKRLVEIRDKLPTTHSAKEHQELTAEAREIESRRKALNQCNLEECEQTKADLYNQYFKLMGIGRTDLAEQYRRMMVQVDSRIQTIHIETAKAEAEKPAQTGEDQKDGKRGKGRGKTLSQSRSSKWSIDLSGLD